MEQKAYLSRIILSILVVILLFNVSAQEISFQNIISQKAELSSQTETNPFQQYSQSSQAKFEITKEQKEANLKEIQNALEESNEVSVLVWLKENQNPEEFLSTLENFEAKYIYHSSNGFAGTADKKTIEQLSQNSKVSYLVLDKEVQGLLQQSRPLIQANLAESTYNITGNGIGVCVLDTGINYTHPSLSNAYAGGYDFVNNDPNPMDENGHGTRVTGVIASRHAAAGRGIAPSSKIIAVKVLNSNALGSLSTIAAGVDWCVTNKNTYNISIISMSLGTVGGIYNPSTNPMSYEPSLANAYNNNIAIVAGSGNDGSTSGIAYPSVSSYVISVGATYDANLGSVTIAGCTDSITYADKVICFSNRAPFLNLMAPGGLITTTQIQGGFGGTWGTSVAAPHVSGTIALMLQRNSQLLPSQIKNILVSTGNTVYDNSTGLTYKRVNAWNAVNAVPYLNKTGNLTSNSVISLNINDKLNPGVIYLLALAFTSTYGLPLPDGRIIPLDYDDLLILSIQDPASVFLAGSVGALSISGRKRWRS
ncbi:MAG: Peptidase S8/S53 [Berkelbacteria bacterium GW2011_GWA1_36_9]|uniref:Peptidase S8/S53 n=1 Tax=Berkelbacteria bacterium GW2011_GWA1_36_9 TaxID=1618331 RepID=A0A0G0FRR7_9BACT|nr:MAG: Peptidase S8/S53 [Berkelbacteria bacterium GW2011_GWA1_36_9]